MHVLITGGAGFIGSHIAEYHLNRGDQVYVIDDLSTGTMENIAGFMDNPHFQFEQDNILTCAHLARAVFWADRIYHMAAVIGFFRVLENPIDVLATNISGCERLLRAVAEDKWRPRVVIASSSSVYGGNTKVPHSEEDELILKSAAHSLWSYSISKLADESFALAYIRKKNARINIVRFFNTIGPRQTGRYGMVVPRLVHQAISGKPLTVYGDGEQTRSFCDVRDTVAMLDALVNNDKSVNEIVNLGNDHETSINELALLIKKITQSDSLIEHVSYEEAYNEQLLDDTRRRVPCLNKLKSLVSYKHQWSLKDTIQDLAQRQRLKLQGQ